MKWLQCLFPQARKKAPSAATHDKQSAGCTSKERKNAESQKHNGLKPSASLPELAANEAYNSQRQSAPHPKAVHGHAISPALLVNLMQGQLHNSQQGQQPGGSGILSSGGSILQLDQLDIRIEHDEAPGVRSGRLSSRLTALSSTCSLQLDGVQAAVWLETPPTISTQGSDLLQVIMSSPGVSCQQLLTLCKPEELLQDVQHCQHLASGTYASVWRGTWHHSTVAIKIVPSSSLQQGSAGVQELVASKRLSHPHIVQAFAVRCAQLTEAFMRRAPSLRIHSEESTAPGSSSAPHPLSQRLSLGLGLAQPGASQHTQASEFSIGPPSCHASRPGTQSLPGGPAASEMSPPTVCSTQMSRISMDSGYTSGDGFGDPVVEGGGAGPAARYATWQDLLTTSKAKQGDYLTAIIMGYCDKGTLSSIITKGVFDVASCPRLGLRALIRTAREVASAMAYLHSMDVVHGDLKPCNVLVRGSRKDRRGFTVRVADFGLCRFLGKDRVAHTSKWGTVDFMAPEYFAGTISKQSDVYAFGVLTWQMYSAKRPYQGLSQDVLQAGVQAGTLRPSWPSGAPSRLVDLCTRCWAHHPEARPTFPAILKELTAMEAEIRAELKAQQMAAQALHQQQAHMQAQQARRQWQKMQVLHQAASNSQGGGAGGSSASTSSSAAAVMAAGAADGTALWRQRWNAAPPPHQQ